jgi:hypothetical protein
VQTDFQETDPANYLSLALELGQRGVNIQSLAARLLLFPNAIIHISEHSLDLDSDTAALFLYGSMDSAKASKALIAQLQAQEPFVRAAAAHLLAEEMTEEAFRTLSTWGGLTEIKEDYRRNDIQAVMKYQAPDPADFANPKWTREQVLQIIAGLPHTRKEFDDVMSTRGAEFDRQMREKKPSQEELAKAVAESEPIYGISDRTSFQNSALQHFRREPFGIPGVYAGDDPAAKPVGFVQGLPRSLRRNRQGAERRSERAISRENLQQNIFETVSFSVGFNSNRRVDGHLLLFQSCIRR